MLCGSSPYTVCSDHGCQVPERNTRKILELVVYTAHALYLISHTKGLCEEQAKMFQSIFAENLICIHVQIFRKKKNVALTWITRFLFSLMPNALCGSLNIQNLSVHFKDLRAAAGGNILISYSL